MALHSICCICMLQSFIFSIEVLYNNLGCRCNYVQAARVTVAKIQICFIKMSMFIVYYVCIQELPQQLLNIFQNSDYKEWLQFPNPKPYSILNKRCPICFHQDKLIYPVTITTIIINPNTLNSAILILIFSIKENSDKCYNTRNTMLVVMVVCGP